MKPRAFNRIAIDLENNVCIKSSTNHSKIKNEIDYYLNLPARIANFFPRLLEFNKDYSSYTLEYISSKSLSELIVTNQISFLEAKNILTTLFNLLDTIHAIKPSIPYTKNLFDDFYIKKTLERIEALKENRLFDDLLSSPSITINGNVYESFANLKNKFISVIHKFMIKPPSFTMIHGDFCFSNILYSVETKEIKLIDPRGSFGNDGIYGHPDYDYAKLLHCLHGGYDYIVNNIYDFEQLSPNNFSFKWPRSLLLKKMQVHFRNLLKERQMDLEFSYLIEALLFLSMVPLHYECVKRQKVLFLIGIAILNNFFERQYETLH